MKTDLTINQLAQQITDRAARKTDYIVPTIALSAELEEVDGKVSMMMASGDDGRFAVNDHAHGQIAAHLEIPQKYYARMLAEQPELLTNNVNTWLGQGGNERRMIRTLDGTMRAFLSDKFYRLDDDAFASTVLPIIGDIPGAEIDSTSITDTRTFVKFTSKTLVRDVKVGDTIQFGVCFSNSEVGAGALEASLFTKRLRCLNGMVSSDEIFSTRHVGQRQGNRDLTRIFKLDTIAADGRATLLKLRDYVSDLMSDRVIDAHMDQLRIASSIPVVKPQETIEKLGKSHGLSEGERNNVLEHLIRGGDLSMFGLSQAITRTAEDARDYERASQLERIGGKLVSATPSKVREMELAA